MNKTKWIELKAKLRKAYRRAFVCGLLIVMAMMSIVMVSMIAGQPVNQKAVVEACGPLIALMAAITGICHFFHGVVAEKIEKLDH